MMSTNLISQNDSRLTINDLQVIEDEPRIKDIVLGERLGLKRAVKIKEVIEANIKEIQGFGPCPLQTDTIKVGCVMRPVKTYYLNEAQALLLCMFSRTAKAAQVRKELIDVYIAYRTRGFAKVREHYRQVTTPSKSQILHNFAPNIKNCKLIPITGMQLNKTFELGELAVAVSVDEYSGAGIYAFHKIDGKTEMYRCIQTTTGKILLQRDNGDPELSCKTEDFNGMSKSKVVSVFKQMDLSTDGFNELQKFLFKTHKPRVNA